MTLKGKRTLIVNGVGAVLPITDAALMFLTEAQGILPPGGYLAYAVGMNAINMYLRSITDTPMWKGSA
jgi:hypothetical protein